MLVRVGHCVCWQGRHCADKGSLLCCSGVDTVLVRGGHCADKGSLLCW